MHLSEGITRRVSFWEVVTDKVLSQPKQWLEGCLLNNINSPVGSTLDLCGSWHLISSYRKVYLGASLSGPVVKTLQFQCRGYRFDPAWETKISHATQLGPQTF